MFGLKKRKKNTKVSKSQDLTLSFACLNLFCLPDFVLFKPKLFHQLEMCIFLILPFLVLCCVVFFEVHCVKKKKSRAAPETEGGVTESPPCAGSSVGHYSRSVSTQHALVQVHGLWVYILCHRCVLFFFSFLFCMISIQMTSCWTMW